MTVLVVLPGLDGTATLHAAFAEAVRSGFESVAVIPYPTSEALDYADIEALVRPLLPRETPFVLLGESFSGPLAISIAAAPPVNLVGVVLSTTFAQSPLPLSRLLGSIARIAPVRALPLPLLSWYLLGRWRTMSLTESLQHALQGVSDNVLRHRAVSALRVNVSSKLGDISVPALYLRATHDRLVPGSCAEKIASATAHCTVVDIEGPHLLLQASPSSSARAVCDFAARLS